MTNSTLLALCRRVLPAGVVVLIAAVNSGSSATRGGDWPQFRGPHSDNKVVGFTVPATWPNELKKGWSVSVGDGLASPALVDGKIYTFTRKGGNEVITCLNATTGKPVWSEKYEAEEVKGPAAGFKGPDKFTGPRSSPAVGDGKVCTFGVAGVLTCLDAATGKKVWQHDTKARPGFFTSCSPTIADGKCIIYTGADGKKGKGGGGTPGKGTLVAYDLATGEAKWKMSGEGPAYGSPVVATVAGVKQVVVVGEASLMGVAFEDGKQLWKTEYSPESGRYQTATPVIDGDVVIVGGSAYKVEKKDSGFSATRLWKDLAPHQYNTQVLKDGILFGYAGMGRNTKVYAQDAKTGKAFWTDGPAGGECGSILDAGEVLVALSSDGNLIVFKGSKDDFKEVAKYKVADSGTWSMPILDGKHIFIKDREALTMWTIE